LQWFEVLARDGGISLGFEGGRGAVLAAMGDCLGSANLSSGDSDQNFALDDARYAPTSYLLGRGHPFAVFSAIDPGTHVVHAIAATGAEVGAVSVLVEPNTLTYVSFNFPVWEQ
jgi:hypothetical protein